MVYISNIHILKALYFSLPESQTILKIIGIGTSGVLLDSCDTALYMIAIDSPCHITADWIIAEACVFCLYEPLKLIPVLIIKIPGNPVPVLIRLITKQIISGSPLCGNIKLLTHFQNRILCQFLIHALYYAHQI